MILRVTLPIAVEPLDGPHQLRDDDEALYTLPRIEEPYGPFPVTVVEGRPFITNANNVSLEVTNWTKRGIKWYRRVHN